MTVTISKPAFNLRETLNALKQKLGAKGSGLLRANTLDEVYSTIGVNRNILINGGMDIWQRGTSWSNNENDNYHADRWHVQRYAANGMQMSRQDAGTSIPFNYCFRLGRVSGNTDTTSYYLNQPVEGINSKRLVGKYATFSFWIRAGATFTPGNYFRCGIAYHTNASYPADGMFYQNFRNASASSNIATEVDLTGKVTSNWQRIEVTGYIPTNMIQVGVFIGATGVGTASGSTDYFEVTGLQLEEGVAATPFEFRSASTELALCQRYYWKSNPTNTAQVGCVNGTFRTSTLVCGFTQFPVTMRTAPTLSLGGTNDHFYVSGYSATAGYSGFSATLGRDGMWAEWTISGGTTSFNAAYNGQASFSAELP